MTGRGHDDDVVNEASEESFPASDAPGWIDGSATSEAPVRRRRLRPGRVLREGVAAGLTGYFAAIVVVGLLDVLRGRSPFHTPGWLGSWLFFGLEDPARLPAPAAPVIAYNGVHLVASLLVGTLGAFLVTESERLRNFWYFAFIVLVAAVTYVLVLMGGMAGEVAGVLDWPTVTLGTAAWFAAMTGYFWKAHRGFLRRIRTDFGAGA